MESIWHAQAKHPENVLKVISAVQSLIRLSKFSNDTDDFSQVINVVVLSCLYDAVRAAAPTQTMQVDDLFEINKVAAQNAQNELQFGPGKRGGLVVLAHSAEERGRLARRHKPSETVVDNVNSPYASYLREKNVYDRARGDVAHHLQQQQNNTDLLGDNRM
jgi:hypothetical protein